MSNIYDVIIVGAGPAGLSAAIYLARAKFSVLVIEKATIGGQITITSQIINYPGIIEDSGIGLTAKMKEQAINFGAEFKIADVDKLELQEPIKTVKTNQGDFKAVGIILATGANPRKLGFKNEQQFKGRGIAYCATCDGEFFTNKEVFVVGGGFAACEEAIFLCKYATKVTMIVRESDFTCAKTISEKVLQHPQIECIFETEVIEVGGNSTLEYITFKNNKDNTTWTFKSKETFGLFIFAGYVPNNTLFKNLLKLTNQGYLETDKNQKTSIDGVYGAGDICDKNLRQVVTAVSDGAIAATSLEKYIPETKQTYQIETLALNFSKQHESSYSKSDNDSLIDENLKTQLLPIFDKLTKKIKLELFIGNDNYSQEMRNFILEVANICDKLEVIENKSSKTNAYFTLSNNDQQQLTYHLIPGGHEFNSFVLALYNLGSVGQPLSSSNIEAIKKLNKINLKIFVSLSCTMCPELVQASQRLAIENELVSVQIYDLAKYETYKEKYNIMSVPCMLIDDQEIYFGKKTLDELIITINKYQKNCI